MKVGDVEITDADVTAIRACLRRNRSGGTRVDDLRRLLRARLRMRGENPDWWGDPAVQRAVSEAVPRLLAKWKREGLIDNPVRGRWVWVGKRGGR